MAAKMAVSHELQHALHVVHYVSPAAIIAYYVLAVTVSTCTLQNLKTRTSPRKILIGFTCMILLSYAVEACMLLIDTLANHGQFSSTDSNVSEVPGKSVWASPVFLTHRLGLYAFEHADLDGLGCVPL